MNRRMDALSLYVYLTMHMAVFITVMTAMAAATAGAHGKQG